MDVRLEGFPLNIRVLQEYLAFARVLNFSTAAREVYISQSTLSTHMQKLEDDLGVNLINHGPKPTLTPSGEKFLEYAGEIVGLFLEAIEVTKQYDREARRLIIEEPQNDGAIFDATMRTISHFAERYPHARLALRSIMGHSPTEALRTDVVDVVKIAHSLAWDDPLLVQECESSGIRYLPIKREAPLVWMQANNPLAKRETLVLEDLRDATIVVPADVRYDDWRALIRSWFKNACMVVPKITMQATETLTEFYMTRLNRRVFILPESTTQARMLLETRNVVSRTITDERCAYHLSLAYKADNANPLLPLYIEHMEEELASSIL